tara:strand:+ start:16645 stop:17607 length:963 start_codon:yes stop_codon:yes gene_type:complete
MNNINSDQKGIAVLIEKPGSISLNELEIDELADEDLMIDVEFSGISTGTERLLFEGRMPNFPGMGYPLVPGYESVGKVIATGSEVATKIGESVFVPGAQCFGKVRGLFGGACSKIVVPDSRVTKLKKLSCPEDTLLALAATAHHVFSAESKDSAPDLIVGHGALGRLLARISLIKGLNPIVIEKSSHRRSGNFDYEVCKPEEVDGKKFSCVVDASGDISQLDFFVSLMAKRGELVLAGFYDQKISFAFVPTFMKEINFRVSAQWQPEDLRVVSQWYLEEILSLDNLITHQLSAEGARHAYETAFNNPSCLKMILDWKEFH